MKRGFTLVEILIATAIFVILAGALFTVLLAGQRTWYTADTSIELQQDLRNSVVHLTKELHQSGFKCENPPDCSTTTVQVTILANSGFNNTDILRFKVPVDYNQDGYIKNTNGLVENWGADLTWGCADFTCQKPLNPEPQSDSYVIEYLVDENSRLLRRVLDVDDSFNALRTDIYANNIIDFSVSRNGNIITLDLSASKVSVAGRTITSSLNVQVFLRNRG